MPLLLLLPSCARRVDLTWARRARRRAGRSFPYGCIRTCQYYTRCSNLGDVPGGELDTSLVLHVHDGEGTRVLLNVRDGTHTSNVVSSGDHNSLAHGELEDTDDLSARDFDLDGVVHLGIGVGKPNRSAVVRGNSRDDLSTSRQVGVGTNGGLLSHVSLLDSTELVLGLLRVDLVEDEAAFRVVDKAEVHASLGDGDDIVEPSRVVEVATSLAIDEDMTSHDNHQGLTASEGELETIAENQGQGEAFSELVRTSGRSGSLYIEQQRGQQGKNIDKE